MWIKLLLLVLFFSVTVAVGLHCKRHSTDVDGFVLGSRSVGPWLTAFAYGTSYFSAVIFVGYAGQFGWRFGLASTWIGLGNAVLGALLAWVVLGRRTRIMTQYLGSATMSDFFCKRFQSPAMRLWASVIIFVFLIPYTASLFNGLSRLFAMAFVIDYAVCIVIMALLTGIYVIAGGYMATAINDFIQGIIMLVGIVAIIFSVLQLNGGFEASIFALAQVEDASVSMQPGVFTSFFGPEPLSLLSVVLLTSLGTWGLPQMVQKFYAIKSEKAIHKGTLISTIFAVIVAGGCYFLGGFGRIFGMHIDVAKEGYDAIVPAMISQLSPFLIGITVILVLSASMSTLSSLVLTSSSTLTLDFIDVFLFHGAGEKKKLHTIRVFVAIFILISVILAIVQYRYHVSFIAQLMGLSWGALAGSFLAPFLYGLYWKRTTKAACFASFLWGAGMMVVHMLFPEIFPAFLQNTVNCGSFVILGSLLLVPAVSLFTKAPDKKTIDDVFACYEEKVLVAVREALSDD